MYLTDKDRPQVFKTPVGGEIGGFLSRTMLDFLIDNYEAKLEDEEKVEGTLCYRISFNQKEGETIDRIQNLYLWIGKEDLLSRKLSYEDLAGNRIVYRFYGWSEVESPLPDLFLFTPPPDVDLFESMVSP
jgi:outer membrane lipoprotein-sorting protein